MCDNAFFSRKELSSALLSFLPTNRAPHLERALAEVDALDGLREDARAAVLRLRAHAARQLDAQNALGEAREVFDICEWESAWPLC
jgi:hypothetical protein